MITEFDDILLKAVEFGNELGLKCYTPSELNIDERRFYLHSVYSDELVPIYARPAIWGKTYFPVKGTKEELESFAKYEHEKGCHTHIREINADSSGYLNEKIKNNLYRLVRSGFHEGAHQVGLESGAIHEPATILIAQEATLLFYRKFGTNDDVKKVKQDIEDYKKYSSEHRERLSERKAALSNGEKISQDHPYNNAYIYLDHICYTHYPLIRKAYEKVSSLTRFIELAPTYPTDEWFGVKEYELLAIHGGSLSNLL